MPRSSHLLGERSASGSSRTGSRIVTAFTAPPPAHPHPSPVGSVNSTHWETWTSGSTTPTSSRVSTPTTIWMTNNSGSTDSPLMASRNWTRNSHNTTHLTPLPTVFNTNGTFNMSENLGRNMSEMLGNLVSPAAGSYGQNLTSNLTSTVAGIYKHKTTVEDSNPSSLDLDIIYSTTNYDLFGNLSNITNSTMGEAADNAMRDFYLGLFLAMSSSLFIGTSFILKKKGLLKLQHRAGQGGYGYLKEWMWWAGMIMMATGEIANFVAYAFAPATLVTPLGALSVLVSAVLASKLLKEHLNLLGKVGCLVCLMGSTVVVIHSPKEQELKTMAELADKLKDPGFILYALFVVVLATVLIFHTSPRYGTSNPLVYITITGTIGSLSVMACKGLGVSLKQTFSGDNQMTNWLTWFILFSVAFCITVQMNYLNKALDIFNTSVVTPILYVVFTTCVIVASAILFKEWGNLKPADIAGNICGFITIVSGIFLLQAFKDMDISMRNLVRIRKEVPTTNGNTSFSPMISDDSRSNLLDMESPTQFAEEEHPTTDYRLKS